MKDEVSINIKKSQFKDQPSISDCAVGGIKTVLNLERFYKTAVEYKKVSVTVTTVFKKVNLHNNYN